jgi:hypothetical protein
MPKFSDVVRSPNDNRRHTRRKTACSFSFQQQSAESHCEVHFYLNETHKLYVPSSNIPSATDSELCLHYLFSPHEKFQVGIVFTSRS